MDINKAIKCITNKTISTSPSIRWKSLYFENQIYEYQERYYRYMLQIHKTPNWETVLLIMCIHHTYFPTTFVRRANGSEYGLHVKLQHIWYDNFKEAPFYVSLRR